MVVEKYEKALNNDAKKFKEQLVESISDYLETYLDEAIPAADIQEAVRNKKAIAVLESLRAHLAVDAALQKESIKEAIIDGKQQISEASKKLESVVQENAQLKSDLDKVKANLLIEQKCVGLDEQQKKYIKKVMSDKSSEFIAENFDYTVKLFNKKTNDRLETLKEEALSESTQVDRVIVEQKQDDTPQQLSPYLKELSKY
jgi:gamma-glutamyl phosphate reductase